MNPIVTMPEKGGRKRPSSQQSSAADLDQDAMSAQSQRSSGTYAHYRWVTLDKARIYICSKPPPKNIQACINAVIQRETSAERKCELAAIAKHLSDEFVAVLNGARREDDSVEPIHNALSLMDSDKRFEFPRKIGIIPPCPPSAHASCYLPRLRLGSES